MAVRTKAAPPTPWSTDLAEPQVDKSAYVHSFSRLIGDVRVGANVFIAPGTSIRADEGTPFNIGDRTNIQDGVVIHGLEKGRVTGADGQKYSVWIGKNTCITHMALIHGPAYVGDECFIGFRSTVFNAKIGDGCIVMMHALIQDVEIPAGKYVPSGAVIVNQQQANRLPDVQESDRSFAHHVVEINEALLAGYRCADDASCIDRKTQSSRQRVKAGKSLAAKVSNENAYMNSVGNMSLSSDIRNQVRSLLSQGCIISTERANKRRFKTKSWLTIGQIDSRNEDRVIKELESILREYQGEYVRLIGVDPQARRRIVEVVIQRPEDTPGEGTVKTVTHHNRGKGGGRNRNRSYSNSRGNLSGEVVQQIENLLVQGCSIGIERASKRRFKTKSWLTVGQVSGGASQVFSEIERTMAEYPKEYIRVIGVDPNARRRMAQIIVQHPGKEPVQSSNSSYGNGKSYSNSNSSSSSSLSSETVEEIRSLLAAGYKIGSEHADRRRFKTKSWQTCSPIESRNTSEVIAALEACLAEHSGEYVRMLGIDPQARRRVAETIIQRPEDNPSARNSRDRSNNKKQDYFVADFTSSNVNGNGSSRPPVYDAFSNPHLDREALEEVRSLLAAGYKIGTEHANRRRFKTKSWQSCSPIDSRNEMDVVAALEACLVEQTGEYVRLIGIDPQAKRRVAETIIQRP